MAADVRRRSGGRSAGPVRVAGRHQRRRGARRTSSAKPGRRRSAAPGGRNTAARPAPSSKSVACDETVGGFDPAWLRHRAGPQEQQPRRAGAGRGRVQPRTERIGRSHEPAAGDIGDLSGGIARTGIGHDHLGEETGGRSRNQRRQRRHERALQFVGGNDGAQHGTVAVDTVATISCGIRRCPTRSSPLPKLWTAAIEKTDRPQRVWHLVAFISGRCSVVTTVRRPRSPIKRARRSKQDAAATIWNSRQNVLQKLEIVLVMFTLARLG